MNALCCPQCGSGDLSEIGRNRFRCQHCGVTSEQDASGHNLNLLVWVCPKCGFDNEKQSDFCGKCGYPLTQECPRCGTGIRWDLRFCPKCGFRIEEGETLLCSYGACPLDATDMADATNLDGTFRGRLTISNKRLLIRSLRSFRSIDYDEIFQVSYSLGALARCYLYYITSSNDGKQVLIRTETDSFSAFKAAFCDYRHIDGSDPIFRDTTPSNPPGAGCCLIKSSLILLLTVTLCIVFANTVLF